MECSIFFIYERNHQGIILNSNSTKKYFYIYIYIYQQERCVVVMNNKNGRNKIIDFSTRPGSDINEKLVLHATFCVNNWSVERDSGHETLKLIL